jgi:serine/threonine protein kinase/tetratricopeptide (TPR) repeat protein
MPLTAGAHLGPYEILAAIGAGGMGEVYRARDTRLKRDVALKIIATEFGGDLDRSRRFDHEARAAAALNHPNILAVYDVGTHDGSPYIVFELLDGETLRERLAHGALPVNAAIEIVSQLVRGLAAAHGGGIVHLDLKPDNIFVTRDGRVKILDFGLAKTAPVVATSMDETLALQTHDGAVLGTVGYMAPEQLRGETADARADVFAVGVILHELIDGRRPFHRGSLAETLSAVLHEEPADLALRSGTPATVAWIVRRCLEKDPVGRFQNVRDLSFALENLADDPSAVPSTTEVGPRSIAVLPFANMSAEPDSQYLSDGLADELINALTHLPGLRVAARTSAFRFRGRDVDIKEIGRVLRVATVVEGSVRRSGQRLRVTVQLINVSDGYQRWSERYDREMADVFAIQDDIVASIIKAIAPTFVGEASVRVKGSTENLDAYELYLKGRQYWYLRSPSLISRAIRSFEQAIALDPDYTLAHAGLADCHSIMMTNGWASAATSRPPAAAALTRAMALDPMLAEVQFSQAQFILYFERDWLQAEFYLRRALELNPRWSLPHLVYGMFLAAAYRLGEAAVHVNAALDLDPLSPYAHAVHGIVRFMDGAYSELEPIAHRVLDLQPDYIYGLMLLAMTLTEVDRAAEAIPFAERLVAVSRAPFYIGMLGRVYARAGRMDDVVRLERELEERRSRGEYVTPSALVYLAIGLRDGARLRRGLEECLADHVPFMHLRAANGPSLDAWRTDVAIDKLLEQIGDGVRPPGSVMVRS